MPYERMKTEAFSMFGGINAKISLYLQGLHEFRDLSNLNFISTGALSKRPGSSLYAGQTLVGQVTGGYEFARLSGASYIVMSANTNVYTVTPGGVPSPFKTGVQNGALFSFVTFVDRLFAANGNDFFKYDGSNTSNYSLPPGITTFSGATISGGMSGIFVLSYGYLNDRGYYGPVKTGITFTLDGSTNGGVNLTGMTTPSGYGITAIALYASNPGFPNMFHIQDIAANSTTYSLNTWVLDTMPANYNLWFTLAPRYLEISNNMLFMAGFSSLPSQVFWSDVGEPEGVDPTFFNEFRTNDGDSVTGLRAFQGNVVVTKERSVHLMSGTNPVDLSAVELTDQYGNLSHRALVVFNDLLWFLDAKGIVEYNGANIGIVSQKMESSFFRMNLPAARQNASAVHFKQFNEVWFSIPIDGSAVNNLTIVYDYVANAWTKYEGFTPSVSFMAYGSMPSRTAFYGDYSGGIYYFSASLFGDNGHAITCMLKNPFLAPMGETVTKMFRRLFLNIDAIPGSSQAITINITQDFSDATISATGVIYQSPFQTRLDFGVPAKAMSYTAYHVSASLPLRIEGYSYEARFQRNT